MTNNQITTCPNCGSFITKNSYEKLYLCHSCGLVYCENCANHGVCPSCGSVNYDSVPIYGLNNAKKNGDIVGGRSVSEVKYIDEQREFRKDRKIANLDISYDGTLVITDSNKHLMNGNLFSANRNLKKVIIDIDARFIHIHSDAFRNATSLKSVEFPPCEYGITIGKHAFLTCVSLKEINFPERCEIGESAFSGCAFEKIILPKHSYPIGKYAFFDCRNLREITLPEGLKKIEEGTFKYCDKLEKINIPDSVEEICKGAFAGCESLKILEISPKVKIDASFACELYYAKVGEIGKLKTVWYMENLMPIEVVYKGSGEPAKIPFVHNGEELYFRFQVDEMQKPKKKIGCLPFLSILIIILAIIAFI